MKSKLMVILVLVLISLPPNVMSDDGGTPIISDHNPEFIEEFVNPITLNWSVSDNDLRNHKIFSNGDLLEEQDYNQTEQGMISITLEFNLGNGRYNFTLLVSDALNHSASSTTIMIKGEEIDNLEELHFLNFSILVVALAVRILYRKKCD